VGVIVVATAGVMLTVSVLDFAAVCDWRSVLFGSVVPVFFVTTVLGGPFLLWVLLGRSAATRV
ncbi:hypothetical protein ACWGK9_37545, partial [Streptomyces rubiginosohelvolus]